MTERTFRYPSHFDQTVKTWRSRRRRIGAAVTVALLVVAFVATNVMAASLASAIMIAVLIAFEAQLRRVENVALQQLTHVFEVRDHLLVHRGANSRELSYIDLQQAFQVNYPFHVLGNAVFHVRQDGREVVFASLLEDCETLVRQILKHEEWPPGVNEP